MMNLIAVEFFCGADRASEGSKQMDVDCYYKLN